MKKVLLTLVLLLSFSSLAKAQATGVSKLGWDQTAPDLATAQAYNYKYYPDSATTGIALTPVTCTLVAGVIHCQAAFPAFTPGAHTITVTASNSAGESPKSGVLSFTFVVIPAAPGTPKVE
jgi:hypothetical protein